LAETAAAPAELRFADARLFRELLGQHDEHVKALERQVGVRIDVADSTLTLHGDPLETELVSRVLLQLYGLLESGYPIYPSDVDYALRILSSDRNAKLRDIFLDTVFISAHKRVITPKSVAQKEYIDAIRNFDIVFGIRAGRVPADRSRGRESLRQGAGEPRLQRRPFAYAALEDASRPRDRGDPRASSPAASNRRRLGLAACGGAPDR